MTSKSKAENIASMSCGWRFETEIARNCHAALERAHSERHNNIDDYVDDGGRGESLEHLERELLHRSRACGELHQSDGEGNRTVFNGIQKFGCERRQNDAVGHRQQHIGKSL